MFNHQTNLCVTAVPIVSRALRFALVCETPFELQTLRVRFIRTNISPRRVLNFHLWEGGGSRQNLRVNC